MGLAVNIIDILIYVTSYTVGSRRMADFTHGLIPLTLEGGSVT